MADLPFRELPSNWKLERLDRLFHVIKEAARIDDEPVSAFIDGVVTLRSNRPDAIIKGSGQEIGYKHLEKGDLVISGMNAHLGGLGISDSSGKCTPVYTILRKSVNLEERFISYYLWHAAQSGYIKSLVNAVRYNSADFGPETVKKFMVPVPPLQIQQKIADYLDLSQEKLNVAISKRLEQVELIELAKMAKLIDVVNNNLGEIFQTRTLNSLCISNEVELGRGTVISNEDIANEPGDFPIYSSAKDNDGMIGSYGHYMFDEELVTWSVDGGGHVFYRPKHKFSVTNVGGYIRVHAKEMIDVQYLSMLLRIEHSRNFFNWEYKAHSGVIQLLYKDLKFPPIKTQKMIVDKYKMLSEKDNVLQKSILQSSKNLLELKKSIISEMVTGASPVPENNKVA